MNSVLRWTLNVFVLIFYCHRILNLLKIPFNTQIVLLACMVNVFICLWACVTVGCLISGSPEKLMSLSIMTTRSCVCVCVCEKVLTDLSSLFVFPFVRVYVWPRGCVGCTVLYILFCHIWTIKQDMRFKTNIPRSVFWFQISVWLYMLVHRGYRLCICEVKDHRLCE